MSEAVERGDCEVVGVSRLEIIEYKEGFFTGIFKTDVPAAFVPDIYPVSLEVGVLMRFPVKIRTIFA